MIRKVVTNILRRDNGCSQTWVRIPLLENETTLAEPKIVAMMLKKSKIHQNCNIKFQLKECTLDMKKLIKVNCLH